MGLPEPRIAPIVDRVHRANLPESAAAPALLVLDPGVVGEAAEIVRRTALLGCCRLDHALGGAALAEVLGRCDPALVERRYSLVDLTGEQVCPGRVEPEIAVPLFREPRREPSRLRDRERLARLAEVDLGAHLVQIDVRRPDGGVVDDPVAAECRARCSASRGCERAVSASPVAAAIVPASMRRIEYTAAAVASSSTMYSMSDIARVSSRRACFVAPTRDSVAAFT